MEAFSDPARSSLTEHAISYLVRSDGLGHPVPARGDDLADWSDDVRRTTHWVSDMRRRPDRIYLDDTTFEVSRIDDPRGRWAAAAFDVGETRVTLAGPPSFLDRRFRSTIARH